MESNGKPGMVHCSASTKAALESAGYTLEFRGELDIKGKGRMATHWVTDVPPASKEIIENALHKARRSLNDLFRQRGDADNEDRTTHAGAVAAAPDTAMLTHKGAEDPTDVDWSWRDHRRGSLPLERRRTSLLSEPDLQRIAAFKQSILQHASSQSDLLQLEVSLDSPGSFSVRKRSSVRSSVNGELHSSMHGGNPMEPHSAVNSNRNVSRNTDEDQSIHSTPSEMNSAASEAQCRWCEKGRRWITKNLKSSTSYAEEDEDLAENFVRKGRELSPEEAAALLRRNADRAEAALPAVADRVVEQKIIRLSDRTGLGAFTMAGLHSDLAPEALPPATLPEPIRPKSPPSTEVTGDAQGYGAAGAIVTQVDPASDPVSRRQEGVTKDLEAEARIRSERMTTAFAQARHMLARDGIEGGGSSGGRGAGGDGGSRGPTPRRAGRCPFGFDLLAAAADDLLQVCKRKHKIMSESGITGVEN